MVILLSEVKQAINMSKTSSEDDICDEGLKLLEDESSKKITNFLNMIYCTGILPHDWFNLYSSRNLKRT